MTDGEGTRTAVLVDSSGPASPSTFTDLQAAQPGGHGGFLHQGGASDPASAWADSYFYPEYQQQLAAWNQEDVRHHGGRVSERLALFEVHPPQKTVLRKIVKHTSSNNCQTRAPELAHDKTSTKARASMEGGA